MNNTCKCGAYSFPHRIGGGKCECDIDSLICSECLMPANVCEVDYGVGHTEAWGLHHHHEDIEKVSECCKADLFNRTTFLGYTNNILMGGNNG